jgi:ribonuclease T1
MRNFRTLIVVAALLFLAWSWQQGTFLPAGDGATHSLDGAPPDVPVAAQVEVADSGRGLPGFLPPEAADTLALIERGGPFPHRQDGSHFQNRERRLPPRPRGHYREYTVRTPGLGHRGPRRIVTGGDPPQDYWYTDDHYASFRRFEVPQ